MSKVFHQLTTLWLKTQLYAVVVSEANNSVVNEWQMVQMNTWQLCHVIKLAFHLKISFYLTQHTPLWRSKFRILRIKKTWTTKGILRISHTSSKLHQDIPSGSFTKSDLRKIGAITDKVWWLSRAHKCSPRRGFRGFAFVCTCILLSFYH